MKTKMVLYKAELDGTGVKEQNFDCLKWLLNFLLNIEEDEGARETRVMALLNGERICTELSMYWLAQKE